MPKTSGNTRWLNIARWTGRSLVIILVLATGLQVWQLFRELTVEPDSGSVEDIRWQPDHMALSPEDDLLRGTWVFQQVDQRFSTGITDPAGLETLVVDYQMRYEEKDFELALDWQGLVGHVQRLVAAAEPSSDQLKIQGERRRRDRQILRKCFVDPADNGLIHVIVAFPYRSDQWWYLATDSNREALADEPAAGDRWQVLTPEMKRLARKLDSRGRLLLTWSQVAATDALDADELVRRWKAGGVAYEHNFPDNPHRFDYTCKLGDETVRVLGIRDEQRIVDLLVLRLGK